MANTMSMRQFVNFYLHELGTITDQRQERLDRLLKLKKSFGEKIDFADIPGMRKRLSELQNDMQAISDFGKKAALAMEVESKTEKELMTTLQEIGMTDTEVDIEKPDELMAAIKHASEPEKQFVTETQSILKDVEALGFLFGKKRAIVGAGDLMHWGITPRVSRVEARKMKKGSPAQQSTKQDEEQT